MPREFTVTLTDEQAEMLSALPSDSDAIDPGHWSCDEYALQAAVLRQVYEQVIPKYIPEPGDLFTADYHPDLVFCRIHPESCLIQPEWTDGIQAVDSKGWHHTFTAGYVFTKVELPS